MASVVEALGGGFAPMQVAMAMGAEAQQSGWFRMVRPGPACSSGAHHCPRGWPTSETTDFDRAHALAAWAAFIKGFRGVNAGGADAAARAVLDSAPPGWDPQGAGDPTIQAFVEPADWS